MTFTGPNMLWNPSIRSPLDAVSNSKSATEHKLGNVMHCFHGKAATEFSTRPISSVFTSLELETLYHDSGGKRWVPPQGMLVVLRWTDMARCPNIVTPESKCDASSWCGGTPKLLAPQIEKNIQYMPLYYSSVSLYHATINISPKIST